MTATSIEAVVFDWGGTLTPFHDVDLLDLWRAAARRLAPERAEEVAAALLAAEQRWWEEAVTNGRSGTTHEVLRSAAAATGLDVPAELHDEALLAHLDAWTPHTRTLPEVAPLLRDLRGRGMKIGLLSNTHWPRQWHEHWLARDNVLELIDARVYTSDLPWLKPHRQAFDAVLAALGGVQPARAVFVGDRPFDDISGAKNAGMRAVLVPNDAVPGYDVVPDATIARLPDLLAVLAGW